jgi:hypothetical protein
MSIVTIEIINPKALDLLKTLDSLDIIRIIDTNPNIKNNFAQYKGAMTRQSVKEVDKQSAELRNN